MVTAQDLGTEEQLTLYHDASGRLYVDDERVWSVNALNDGIVALTTGIRVVHISAADYWKVMHGESDPNLQDVGVLAARLAHLTQHATALIAAIASESAISPAAYPAIWKHIMALRTALGPAEAEGMAPVDAAT